MLFALAFSVTYAICLAAAFASSATGRLSHDLGLCWEAYLILFAMAGGWLLLCCIGAVVVVFGGGAVVLVILPLPLIGSAAMLLVFNFLEIFKPGAVCNFVQEVRMIMN